VTLNAIETALATQYSSPFNYRRGLLVPNVYTGLNLRHECDLLYVTGAGVAHEIEIKTSKSDLKRDLSKPHGHVSDKIKYLWFAVPEDLKEQVVAHIDNYSVLREQLWKDKDKRWSGYKIGDPVANAGIIILKEYGEGGAQVVVLRKPKANPARKLTPAEITKLHYLAYLRYWSNYSCEHGTNIEAAPAETQAIFKAEDLGDG
jgi:hypothetical protein